MSDFVKYEDLKIGAMYEFHVCGNVQSFKLIHKEGERFVVLKEPYKELDIWCNVASAKFKSLEDGALRDREATEFSQFLEEMAKKMKKIISSEDSSIHAAFAAVECENRIKEITDKFNAMFGKQNENN